MKGLESQEKPEGVEGESLKASGASGKNVVPDSSRTRPRGWGRLKPRDRKVHPVEAEIPGGGFPRKA